MFREHKEKKVYARCKLKQVLITNGILDIKYVYVKKCLKGFRIFSNFFTYSKDGGKVARIAERTSKGRRFTRAVKGNNEKNSVNLQVY